MARVPAPQPTPDGPAYEGRLLDRADEEVVDQGLRFDIGTLMSRRGILGLMGLGAGSLALAACTPAGGAGPTTTAAPTPTATADGAAVTSPGTEIPDETAGPYPGDGSNGPDVLEQTGIIRSDLRTSLGGGTAVEGVPLEFTLRIVDIAGGDVPFSGVAVYAWHCDAQGRYSMYSGGVENETWLRGVQVADANGEVTFTSIVPGCYAGRWTHIHFEVYPDADSITDPANAIATSQLAFPEASLAPVYELAAYDGSARNLSQITLASDNVFGDDGGEHQLATVTGDVASGYVATLDVWIDTTTAPSASGAPGGGQPPRG